MKRSFLTALGLEKDIIDQIMAEHGNTIEIIKEKSKEDNEKQVNKMQKSIDSLQEKIDNTPVPKVDNEDWKGKYDTLKIKYDTDIEASKKDFDEYKSSIENEKSIATKQSILRKQLTADGANTKLISLLEKEFDIAKLEIDGDKIKDWDNISKTIRENYSDIFGTTTIEGVKPANPPTNNNTPLDPFIAGFDGK